MKTIDMLGKPCPVPVMEAKKALAENEVCCVLVKVDNYVAVQNLERMANGYGYSFSFVEHAKDSYEITIDRAGKKPPDSKAESGISGTSPVSSLKSGVGVAIGRDTMGEGAEELGKILIKGFIYSLTELPNPPEFVAFYNSGAFLTSEDANTIDDLKTLVEKGTEIITCGTCVNYYELKEKLAVGVIMNTYEIAEKMATIASVINI